jgi:hypothetical protein
MSEDTNDSFRKELSFTKEDFPVDEDYDRLADVFDSLELEEIQVTVSVSEPEAQLYKDLFDGLFDSDSEEQDQESDSGPTVRESDEESDEEPDTAADRELVEKDTLRFGIPDPDEVQTYTQDRQEINRNTRTHYVLALLAAETDPEGGTWFTARQLENLEHSPLTRGQAGSALSRLFHDKKYLKRTGVEEPDNHGATVKYRPTEADRKIVASLGRFEWPDGVEEPDVVPSEEERPFVL